MTKAAQAEGRKDLIMTPDQWQKLVVPYMKSSRVNDFSKEIIRRVGDFKSVDEVNKWMGLAMNIWNNTPQPDRGGRSPSEIVREYDTQSGG